MAVSRRFLAASPFQPVLAEAESALPPVLRDQYLLCPEDGFTLRFVGHLDEVWHRPRWLWPVFWWLSRWNILFPEQGQRVPTTMLIEATRDRAGRCLQTWRRTMVFGRVRRHFNAILAFDPSVDRVVEWFGPANLLQVVWRVRFAPPDTMLIATERSDLQVLGRRFRLPPALAIDVQAREWVSPRSADAIAVDICMSHAWLGPIFGYSGTFSVFRCPQESVHR